MFSALDRAPRFSDLVVRVLEHVNSTSEEVSFRPLKIEILFYRRYGSNERSSAADLRGSGQSRFETRDVMHV